MKNLLLFTILLFTVTSFAQSDRWRLLTSSNDGDNIHYDTETINKKGNIFTIWFRFQEGVKSSKGLTEIDCANQKSRRIRTINYDESGNVLNSYEIPSKWTGFIPETIGETMFKVFCENEPDSQAHNEYADKIYLAAKYQSEENYTAALNIYNELLKIHTDNAYLYNFKANVLVSLNRLNEAKQAISKSIVLDPNIDSSYYILGEICEKQNNLPLAEINYWKSIKLSEGYSSGYYSLKRIYNKSKNTSKLIELYQYGINNNIPSLYVDLANIYDKSGKKSLAKTIRLKGVALFEAEIESNNYENAYDLAQLYNGLNRFVDSIRFVRKVLPFAENNYQKIVLLYRLRDAYKYVGNDEKSSEIDLEIKNLQSDIDSGIENGIDNKESTQRPPKPDGLDSYLDSIIDNEESTQRPSIVETIPKSDITPKITTKKPTENKVFTETYVGGNSRPTITIKNDAGRVLTLVLGGAKYLLQADETLQLTVDEGNYEYFASTPTTNSLSGVNKYKNGYAYTWEFYISTSPR